jgi:hypothetical protein
MPSALKVVLNHIESREDLKSLMNSVREKYNISLDDMPRTKAEAIKMLVKTLKESQKRQAGKAGKISTIIAILLTLIGYGAVTAPLGYDMLQDLLSDPKKVEKYNDLQFYWKNFPEIRNDLKKEMAEEGIKFVEFPPGNIHLK